MLEQSKLLECSARKDNPRYEQTYLQLEPKAAMIFGFDVGERNTKGGNV